MEEDILNYSPAVMFRGTPCNFWGYRFDSGIVIFALRVTLNHAHCSFKGCQYSEVHPSLARRGGYTCTVGQDSVNCTVSCVQGYVPHDGQVNVYILILKTEGLLPFILKVFSKFVKGGRGTICIRNYSRHYFYSNPIFLLEYLGSRPLLQWISVSLKHICVSKILSGLSPIIMFRNIIKLLAEGKK